MLTWTAAPSQSVAKARDPEFIRAIAVALHGNPDANVSNSQLAAFLGLAPSTASRLRTGQQGAGHKVLLRGKRRFPNTPLNDLFTSDKNLDEEVAPL